MKFQYYFIKNSISFRRRTLRSSRPEVFCKEGVLKNFANFTGKHLCQSLFFNENAGLSPATLLKRRLWHKCFLVNFANFLGTPFLCNTSSGCFWTLSKRINEWSVMYNPLLSDSDINRVKAVNIFKHCTYIRIEVAVCRRSVKSYFEYKCCNLYFIKLHAYSQQLY